MEMIVANNFESTIEDLGKHSKIIANIILMVNDSNTHQQAFEKVLQALAYSFQASFQVTKASFQVGKASFQAVKESFQAIKALSQASLGPCQASCFLYYFDADSTVIDSTCAFIEDQKFNQLTF
jgi:hypothetical protein